MKQMIGISVGSLNTVIGVLKNNNVDIILSETSSRTVPTLSAFSDRERLSGDSAMSIIKSNYLRTINYPRNYLGIQADWPYLKEETKFATAQPVIDHHNKVAFEITYKGEQEVVYPEAAMGLFFNKLKKNWLKEGYETNEVVVGVPDYYTTHERKAMIDALSIANLSCTSLVNESSCIVLNYGLFRRTQFDEKNPRIVAFVDMGQSKTSIVFGSFTKNLSKVISVTSDRFCGARDLDYYLMLHFSKVFEKKYGCDPSSSVKTRLRMMEAISKTRKILSGNREATLSIESLMEDEDLNYNLTREELESIVSPVLEKYRELIKISLEKAVIEGSKIINI
jgi:heat shock protein 4